MASMELLSPEGFRLDGRKAFELRRMVCKIGVLEHSNGSAYIEQGNTKVIVKVTGPHEMQSKAKALHDKAVVKCEFSISAFAGNERRKRGRGDRKSAEISLTLEKIFDSSIQTDLFPRTQIDIYVQVLQADGGFLSSCINGATMALIDAGIPMTDFVCSCMVCCVDGTPVVDVNTLEENSGVPRLVLAILPKTQKIVLFQTDSRLHIDYLERMIEAAKEGCRDIFTVVERTVKEHCLNRSATSVV